MRPKMVIRYLSGRNAGQMKELPGPTLTLGRDAVCEVPFDAEQDDLVSRNHARINVEGETGSEVWVTDLASRNGTFVNRQRITGRVRLNPGDRVQLGAGGPEVEFDLNPRPAAVAGPTRMADTAATTMPTRQAPLAAAPPPAPPAAKSRGPVIAAGLAGLLGLGVLGFYGSRLMNPTMGPREIAALSLDSVVLLEVGWKLIDTETGRPINQVYIPNSAGKDRGPLIQGAGDLIPVYVQINDALEPLLTTDTGDGRYRAIGGIHTGSGFVVSEDGFILTNRHVAASWNTSYTTFAPGLAFTPRGEGKWERTLVSPPRDWVPVDARYLIRGPVNLDNLSPVFHSAKAKALEGRNDYLDVTFARNRIRVPAKLARVSDRADVAMVKIELPRKLKPLAAFDNYDNIQVGDALTVVGYPGISPDVVAKAASQDVLGANSRVVDIPDPTVTPGNVGRVVRSSGGVASGDQVRSSIGDVYQLTVTATGSGNSGGPVLDDHGRVIGLFTMSSSRSDGTRVTFAVPIRYGIELMGLQKVM